MKDYEKNVVGQILKGFAQTETVVNDYWSTLVTKWFRKPEIIMMGTTLGSSETIHAEAYSLLNEQLGLDNFAEFMEDEATMAKIESLMNVRDNHDGTANWHDRAKSLAIFSAFTEGVNLFSSFAVLLSFKMRNKLKGVGQIVEWSVRDESLHSEAGCWLFRTLMKEQPKFKTKKLVNEIEEAARLALQLEFDFIDKVFEMGDLENLGKEELKNFIKHRVNTKMADLGLEPIIPSEEIDKGALKTMKWFDAVIAGKQHTDFFANRVTNYSKGHLDWSNAF
jgi:ribonucleoside-diphosphate reductase beta chain